MSKLPLRSIYQMFVTFLHRGIVHGLHIGFSPKQSLESHKYNLKSVNAKTVDEDITTEVAAIKLYPIEMARIRFSTVRLCGSRS